MDLERFDELCRELEKAALTIERCQIELGEVREEGVPDADLGQIGRINAALAAAGKKFEQITMELKSLSTKNSEDSENSRFDPAT